MIFSLALRISYLHARSIEYVYIDMCNKAFDPNNIAYMDMEGNRQPFVTSGLEDPISGLMLRPSHVEISIEGGLHWHFCNEFIFIEGDKIIDPEGNNDIVTCRSLTGKEMVRTKIGKGEHCSSLFGRHKGK